MGITYSTIKVRYTAIQNSNIVARLTGVDTGLADITNGSALDHVPHGETLDGLVLSNDTRAVGAADDGNVATALLVASIISSLLGLRTQGI